MRKQPTAIARKQPTARALRTHVDQQRCARDGDRGVRRRGLRHRHGGAGAGPEGLQLQADSSIMGNRVRQRRRTLSDSTRMGSNDPLSRQASSQVTHLERVAGARARARRRPNSGREPQVLTRLVRAQLGDAHACTATKRQRTDQIPRSPGQPTPNRKANNTTPHATSHKPHATRPASTHSHLRIRGGWVGRRALRRPLRCARRSCGPCASGPWSRWRSASPAPTERHNKRKDNSRKEPSQAQRATGDEIRP